MPPDRFANHTDEDQQSQLARDGLTGGPACGRRRTGNGAAPQADGTAAAVATLANLLTTGHDTPVEQGATAVFEAIACAQIRAEVSSAARHELTGGEWEALKPRASDTACLRTGRLYTAGGVPVAETTTVLLPRRIPIAAREALGINWRGIARDGQLHVPIGKALRGCGVRRRQLEVTPTPGYAGADGALMVLYSRALLVISAPIAVVTERVYADFLSAFPLPWPTALTLTQPGPAAPAWPELPGQRLEAAGLASGGTPAPVS